MAFQLPKLPLIRFYRRIPIIPGMLWLNIFKWGISLSIGKQGFRLTLGRSNFRGTIGLTGTGLFLTKNIRRPATPPSETLLPTPRNRKPPRISQTPSQNHGKEES